VNQLGKGKRRQERVESAKMHAEYLRKKKQAKKENKQKLQAPRKKKKK